MQLLAFILPLFAVSHGFRIQPRILNGYLTDYRKFPFYVHLSSKNGRCGATLLSNRWLVTAAHCVQQHKETTAFFGIRATGEFTARMNIPTSNQFIHPNFNQTAYTDDIALIHLPKAIRFNQFIQPSTLTNVSDASQLGGQVVVAAGTGRNKLDQPISDCLLRFANFLTISSQLCVRQMLYEMNPNAIICAGVNFANNNQSIYKGDSGGPLILHKDGKVIGLMSLVQYFSVKDRRPKFQVFTNIPFYYQWIESQSGLKLPLSN